MTAGNTKGGILLMIATTFVFACQDGISRHLAGEYNTLMVVMIRYWFFAAFVLTIAVAACPRNLRSDLGIYTDRACGKPRRLRVLSAYDHGTCGPAFG